jgi:hypothetical protein
MNKKHNVVCNVLVSWTVHLLSLVVQLVCSYPQNMSWVNKTLYCKIWCFDTCWNILVCNHEPLYPINYLSCVYAYLTYVHYNLYITFVYIFVLPWLDMYMFKHYLWNHINVNGRSRSSLILFWNVSGLNLQEKWVTIREKFKESHKNCNHVFCDDELVFVQLKNDSLHCSQFGMCLPKLSFASTTCDYG